MGKHLQSVPEMDPFSALVGILPERTEVQHRDIKLGKCVCGKAVQLPPARHVAREKVHFRCRPLESAVAQIGNAFEEGAELQRLSKPDLGLPDSLTGRPCGNPFAL